MDKTKNKLDYYRVYVHIVSIYSPWVYVNPLVFVYLVSVRTWESDPLVSVHILAYVYPLYVHNWLFVHYTIINTII